MHISPPTLQFLNVQSQEADNINPMCLCAGQLAAANSITPESFQRPRKDIPMVSMTTDLAHTTCDGGSVAPEGPVNCGLAPTAVCLPAIHHSGQFYHLHDSQGPLTPEEAGTC